MIAEQPQYVALKNFRERHLKAKQELKRIAMPILDKIEKKGAVEAIGKYLNVSGQTVLNYVYGNGKDGFLVEAITNQFLIIQENIEYYATQQQQQ